MMIIFEPLRLYCFVSLASQSGLSRGQEAIKIGLDFGSLARICLSNNCARVDLPLAGVPRTFWGRGGVRTCLSKTAQVSHQDKMIVV